MISTAHGTTLEKPALNLPGQALPPSRPGEQRRKLEPDQLAVAAELLQRLPGARLATMIGLDERRERGTFRLVYLFALDQTGEWVSLEADVPADAPVYPALTPVAPAAHWYEREARDLLGIEPVGHPDPRRLVLHDNWPAGVYPLRHDFDPAMLLAAPPAPPYRFLHLHGDGLVEIPVGPIHAGVIEPGHFRFAAVGEVVLHLEARLFYTHRGIEKLAEGRTAESALTLAERICGACSCSHAAAFCQAVETLAGIDIPPRAAALRVLFLELERLYNHLGDLGNICAGTGFAVGTAFGARLKEMVQSLNERLCGSRYLHDVCRPGGVVADLTDDDRRDVAATLAAVQSGFRDFAALLLGAESFTDRLHGSGVLDISAVQALGAVGITARASGLSVDSRRDHPGAGYEQRRVEPVVEEAGDVWARMRVRMREAEATLDLLQSIIEALPAGCLIEPIGTLPARRQAFGWSESPRGENIHWLHTGPDGLIERYRVRSASFCNWPLVALAVPGNPVPDFPLINKSFELCYACLDR